MKEMKEPCFSTCTDGSNHQNLEKMNPVTVRIFDNNQHKVVNKLLDIYLSKASTAAAIFSSIGNVFQVNKVPWEKCLSLRVEMHQ